MATEHDQPYQPGGCVAALLAMAGVLLFVGLTAVTMRMVW